MGSPGLEREQRIKLHFWQCSLFHLQKAWGGEGRKQTNKNLT